MIEALDALANFARTAQADVLIAFSIAGGLILGVIGVAIVIWRADTGHRPRR